MTNPLVYQTIKKYFYDVTTLVHNQEAPQQTLSRKGRESKSFLEACEKSSSFIQDIMIIC